MSRSRTQVTLVGLGVAVGAGVVLARRQAGSPPGVDSPQPGPRPVPPPLPVGREQVVRTSDGVALHVEVHGPADLHREPAATVVLLHGYVQSSRLWAGQVRDLVDARPDLRVVVHDHRGHGRSGPTAREAATIEQLARDLVLVLEAVAPTGPLVLVGHSMGGMTLMALAEQHPELFGPADAGGRVVGAAFVATSSGGLGSVTWGLPAPVAAAVRRAMPALNERQVRDEARGRQRRIGRAERRLVFGRGADPEHVREVLEVQAQTRAETTAAFLATFSSHDRAAALAALADVPALVVVGDRDLLCPLPHSRAIAAALPRSELVVYPGVGHMVQVERRPEVSARLLALLDRVVPATAPVG